MKEHVIHEFPAYRIVRREPGRDGHIPLVYGDVLYNDKSTYEVGSVVGYMLETGHDPIAAVDRARERKHKLHWINARAASITSYRRAQERVVQVDFDATYKFEGRIFRIRKAPNKNLEFEPVD